MLAEIYMYNDINMLAGLDYKLNAGTFHAIMAKWLGHGSHPLGLEVDPGEEKWNYPLHAFASSFARRSSRQVEVNTNIRYAKDSEDGEYDESPAYSHVLLIHEFEKAHYDAAGIPSTFVGHPLFERIQLRNLEPDKIAAMKSRPAPRISSIVTKACARPASRSSPRSSQSAARTASTPPAMRHRSPTAPPPCC